MSSKDNNLTRLLCASIVMQGGLFRERVLDLLKERYRAVSPEIGLDLDLVAQVSKFMDRRDTNLYIILSIITAIGVCTLPFSLIIFIPLTAAIVFFKTYDERSNLVSAFKKDKFDPDYVRAHMAIPLDSTEQGVVPSDEQNLIVYRDFSPFVGAGIEMAGWSFAVDVTRPKENSPATDKVSIDDLYAALEQTIASLQLPNMLARDMWFVNGTDIRTDNQILPDILGRPVQVLPEQVTEQYKHNSDLRVRHYKWITIEDWDSELVLSLFMRCSLRGRNLFVEVNRFLLTPLAEQHHAVDALPPQDVRSIINLGLQSLVSGPVLAFTSVFIMAKRLSAAFDGLFGSSRHEKEVKNNLLYNYGSGTSIRESAASPNFRRYFQKLDYLMYAKIFDREVTEMIVDFLDQHNIDTSDLKERQTTILNNGVIVQGGNLQAETVAVGSGSKAISNITNFLRGGDKEKS